MHELDLTKGAVLERGCVYIAEIAERLALPPDVSRPRQPEELHRPGRRLRPRCSPTTAAAFDDIAEGYAGPIYLEIAPQTFSVLARTGTRLNQLRLKRGEPPTLSVRSVGVDLTGGLAGYRARRHAGVIDLDREDGHDPRDFWEPLEPRRGELLLDPGEFYILASKEAIEIPVLRGGRDDPHRPGGRRVPRPLRRLLRSGLRHRRDRQRRRSRGVLEVRSHETPFLLEDGQTVARLVYQPLTERPVAALRRERQPLPAPGPEALQALPALGLGLCKGRLTRASA